MLAYFQPAPKPITAWPTTLTSLLPVEMAPTQQTLSKALSKSCHANPFSTTQNCSQRRVLTILHTRPLVKPRLHLFALSSKMLLSPTDCFFGLHSDRFTNHFLTRFKVLCRPLPAPDTRVNFIAPPPTCQIRQPAISFIFVHPSSCQLFAGRRRRQAPITPA